MVFKKTRLMKFVSDKSLEDVHTIVDEFLQQRFRVEKKAMYQPHGLIPTCTTAQYVGAFTADDGLKTLMKRAIVAELADSKSIFLYARDYALSTIIAVLAMALGVLQVSFSDIPVWLVLVQVAFCFLPALFLSWYEDRQLKHLAAKLEKDDQYFAALGLDDQKVLTNLGMVSKRGSKSPFIP